MTASTISQQNILADLRAIQDLFRAEVGRFYKKDVLARFMDNEELSAEARLMAAEVVDGLYEGTVWEDDVFGSSLGMALDHMVIRYERKTIHG